MASPILMATSGDWSETSHRSVMVLRSWSVVLITRNRTRRESQKVTLPRPPGASKKLSFLGWDSWDLLGHYGLVTMGHHDPHPPPLRSTTSIDANLTEKITCKVSIFCSVEWAEVYVPVQEKSLQICFTSQRLVIVCFMQSFGRIMKMHRAIWHPFCGYH